MPPNKSQLVSLLSEYLTSDGQMVHISREDTDKKVVSTSLELSKGSNGIVAADDTDVVIMLLHHHHHQNQISDICFPQERGKNGGALKKLPKKLHAKNICEINSLQFAGKKTKKKFLNLKN